MRLALTAVALVAIAATGCASVPDGTFAVHGTEYVCSSVSSPRVSYPGIASGARVTVLDSSGRAIGTGTLAAAAGESTSMAGRVTVFTWHAVLPRGLARYGVSLAGEKTAWFTGGQMAAGPVAGAGC